MPSYEKEKIKGNRKRIIVFCQDPNRLIRELVTEIAKELGHCTLVAGHDGTESEMEIPNVTYIPAPSYKRADIRSRAFSWITYTIYSSVRMVAEIRRSDLLLFVSSPPFVGILGYVAKKFFNKKYVLLINDIYPDVVENFGVIKKNGALSKLWRMANKLTYLNAERIVTLSEEMSLNILSQMPIDHGKDVTVIPTWVDTDEIRPIRKSDNSFAVNYDQVGKLTVMYAGNFGNAADISLLPSIARKFQCEDVVHFMFIGRGRKSLEIKKMIDNYNLKNVTMLPYQPESVLPFMLATADIGIVSLDQRIKCMSVPSKTYYYMAAGSAIIAHCAAGDVLERIVNEHRCGIVAQSEEQIVAAIKHLVNDKNKLTEFKNNSRRAAEIFFDKKMCISKFLEVVQDVCFSLGHQIQ